MVEYPNTFPFPNEIINGWNTRLNLSEFRTLLIIVRKTLGWVENRKTGMRKEEDWISYKQLLEKTGLSTASLSNAIDSLVKYKLIQIRNKKGELLHTKEKRRQAGRRKDVFIYRLNLTTLKSKTHYFKNQSSTTLKSKDYKRNSLQKKPLQIIPKGITKQSFGNPDINFLLSYLKEKLALPMLDGSEKSNRKFCWLGLKKFGGREKMTLLINALVKDDFWKTKITSFQSLYYKGVRIISETRKKGGVYDATDIG